MRTCGCIVTALTSTFALQEEVGERYERVEEDIVPLLTGH